MDWFPALPWDEISTVSIILLVGYLVLSGRLRTDRNVQEIRHDRDDRLKEAQEDADRWRQAYLNAEASRQSLQNAVTSLLEVGRTTEAVLKALDAEAHSHGGDEHDR